MFSPPRPTYADLGGVLIGTSYIYPSSEVGFDPRGSPQTLAPQWTCHGEQQRSPTHRTHAPPGSRASPLSLWQKQKRLRAPQTTPAAGLPRLAAGRSVAVAASRREPEHHNTDHAHHTTQTHRHQQPPHLGSTGWRSALSATMSATLSPNPPLQRRAARDMVTGAYRGYAPGAGCVSPPSIRRSELASSGVGGRRARPLSTSRAPRPSQPSPHRYGAYTPHSDSTGRLRWVQGSPTAMEAAAATAAATGGPTLAMGGPGDSAYEYYSGAGGPARSPPGSSLGESGGSGGRPAGRSPSGSPAGQVGASRMPGMGSKRHSAECWEERDTDDAAIVASALERGLERGWAAMVVSTASNPAPATASASSSTTLPGAQTLAANNEGATSQPHRRVGGAAAGPEPRRGPGPGYGHGHGAVNGGRNADSCATTDSDAAELQRLNDMNDLEERRRALHEPPPDDPPKAMPLGKARGRGDTREAGLSLSIQVEDNNAYDDIANTNNNIINNNDNNNACSNDSLATHTIPAHESPGRERSQKTPPRQEVERRVTPVPAATLLTPDRVPDPVLVPVSDRVADRASTPRKLLESLRSPGRAGSAKGRQRGGKKAGGAGAGSPRSPLSSSSSASSFTSSASYGPAGIIMSPARTKTAAGAASSPSSSSPSSSSPLKPHATNAAARRVTEQRKQLEQREQRERNVSDEARRGREAQREGLRRYKELRRGQIYAINAIMRAWEAEQLEAFGEQQNSGGSGGSGGGGGGGGGGSGGGGGVKCRGGGTVSPDANPFPVPTRVTYRTLSWFTRPRDEDT